MHPHFLHHMSRSKFLRDVPVLLAVAMRWFVALRPLQLDPHVCGEGGSKSDVGSALLPPFVHSFSGASEVLCVLGADT